MPESTDSKISSESIRRSARLSKKSARKLTGKTTSSRLEQILQEIPQEEPLSQTASFVASISGQVRDISQTSSQVKLLPSPDDRLSDQSSPRRSYILLYPELTCPISCPQESTDTRVSSSAMSQDQG